MRDDFKIGILLCFLLFVGIFVWWLVHAKTPGSSGDNPAVDLTGQTGGESRAPSSPSAEAAPPPPPAQMPQRSVLHDWSSGPVGGELADAPSTPPPSVPATVPPSPPGGGLDRAVDDRIATTPPGGSPPVRPDTPAVAAGNAAWNALEVSPEGKRLYKVQSGDRAWTLAQRFYEDGNQHKLLVEANPSVTDWNRLPIGATLVIPPPPARTPGRAAPGAPATAGPDEYVIEKDDTLGLIAEKKLGSFRLWPKIVEVNPGLDERNLQPGKVIKLPRIEPGTAPGGAAGSGSTRRTPGPNDYVVKAEDSLWSIAKTQLGNGARHDEIYQLNKEAIGPDPNKLKEGMTLKLPPKEPSGGGTGSGSGASGSGGVSAPGASGSGSSSGDAGETVHSGRLL